MQFHFLSLIAPLRFLFCLINLDVEQVTNVMLRIRGTRSPSRARRYHYQWYDGPRGVGHIKNDSKIKILIN